jgi:hypothetical protein
MALNDASLRDIIKRINIEDKEMAIVTKPNSEIGKPNSKTDQTKSVGVYIEKLMSRIEMGTEAKEEKKKLNTRMIKNANIPVNTSSEITLANYFKVPPARKSNVSESPHYLGETCRVEFVDGNVTIPRYKSEMMDENCRTADRYRVFVMDRNTVKDLLKEYEFVMDTKEGIIRLATSDGRNEVDRYTIEIDTKNGAISVKDTRGQKFYLNTNRSQIYMKNAKGTIVECVGDVVNVRAASVNIKSPIVNMSGDLVVKGSITADGTIIDKSGNTKNHIH